MRQEISEAVALGRQVALPLWMLSCSLLPAGGLLPVKFSLMLPSAAVAAKQARLVDGDLLVLGGPVGGHIEIEQECSNLEGSPTHQF